MPVGETPPDAAREIPVAGRLFALTVSRGLDLAALRAAVELGVPDHLGESPRPVVDVARELGCNPDSLARLLRVLVNQDVVREPAANAFCITGLGALLKKDSAGSLRDFLELGMHPSRARALEKLGEAVRTGRTAFEEAHGEPEFEYFGKHPELAAVFQRAMSSLTAGVARALLEVYPFSGVRSIADIGGGHGQLLGSLLQALPDRTGLLFDLPYAEDGARRHLTSLGVMPRCRVVAGNFFEAVPSGADLYLLKSVLHNWDDARAQKIVTNVAAAMPPEARLLILETLMPGDRQPSPVYEMDLNMLAFPGGRERTATEYEGLLTRAGLRMHRILALGDLRWVLEAVPVGSTAPSPS